MSHFLHNLWSANTFTVTVLSIVLAMVIGAILIIVSDSDVLDTFSYFTARPTDALTASWDVVSNAYADLFKGAIFDPAAVTALANGTGTWTQVFTPISETLTYAAPLVFTGLSVALAFRGGLFNIGGQGQAVIGTITAAVAGFALPLPIVIHLIVALVAGLLGGALWGFIPGILKARTGAHEVITTIMLNYTAGLFLTWLILQKGVQDPDRTDAISKAVDSSAQLASLRRRAAGEPRHRARRPGHRRGRLAAQPVRVRLRAARGRRQPGRRQDRRHQRRADVHPAHGRGRRAGRARRRDPGAGRRAHPDPAGGRQHRLRRPAGRPARPEPAVGHAARRAAVRRAAAPAATGCSRSAASRSSWSPCSRR